MNHFKRAMLCSVSLKPTLAAIQEKDPPPNWVAAYMAARQYDPEAEALDAAVDAETATVQ